jgi:geranylgeranyl pyrophosphate synthase
LLKALELSKGEYHEQLIGLINSKTIGQDEKVKKVIEIYKQLNIDTITNEFINKYFTRAADCLAKLEKNGLNIETLTEYSQMLSGRKF